LAAHSTARSRAQGLEIKPGKAPTPLNLERRLVIKQAALSVSKPSSEPVVLSVSVNAGSGQQFVVCRLHEGKVEHCPLELPFTPEDQPLLHLKGSHAVHLTGFLEMEEEDELDEADDMEDATATKVAAPKALANGKPKAAAVEEEDDDDDDDFEEGEEEMGEEDDEGEEEDDDEGEEEDDDEGEEEEESEEEEEAPPPKAAKAAKRPPPAAAAPAAAPPAKKAKASAAAPAPKASTPAAKAATPKAATPKAATPKAATPAATTPAASPGSNSWSASEDAKLQKALAKIGPDVDGRWDKVAKEVGTRNKDQCKKRQKQMKGSPGA